MRKLVLLAALVVALAAAAPASAATFFHSPSGNIRCVIEGTSFTRCDITDHDWSPPPKPGHATSIGATAFRSAFVAAAGSAA